MARSVLFPLPSGERVRVRGGLNLFYPHPGPLPEREREQDMKGLYANNYSDRCKLRYWALDL